MYWLVVKKKQFAGNFVFYAKFACWDAWIFTSGRKTDGIKKTILAGKMKLYNRACWQKSR